MRNWNLHLNLKELSFMKLLLNGILDCVFRCGGILLIIVMKLDDVISKWGHINQNCRSTHDLNHESNIGDFQYAWFKKFPWLEYSPSKDALFCFPCYIFELSEAQQCTFTIEGFRSWKRVNDGGKCAFLSHMGSSNSVPNNSAKSVIDLMNVTRHIDKVMNRESSEQIQKNRLRLTTPIECVRWLSLQACGLRGHDEFSDSQNRGNFIEMLKFMGKWNASIGEVILEKAPGNAKYNLEIHNMRGQGYDGASNMSGVFNGLQALFLRDCPYAYYVHCFAHHLQLALVASPKKEISIWIFFSNLTTIVNLVTSSSKRNSKLQSAQVNEISRSIVAGERETGRGANQLGTLNRAGTTRWSSHFDSICRLIDMYDATILVLESISTDGSSTSMRGEAGGSLIVMKSFDFIFILHLMHKIMAITDLLCRALQHKSLDILSAMDLVSTTKELLLTLRNDGFDILLSYVKSFCTNLNVDIPDMSAHYKHSNRSCQQKDTITFEHHFHYDIFNVAIDFQLEELNSRFSDEKVELLMLSSALDPNDNFKCFDIDKILTLAEKYYPEDFTEHEMHHLKCQLQHYELDVVCHENFQNMSTISELCQGLFETKKLQHYNRFEKLIHLVLILPVSTATTEHIFLAMKHVKTILRNKMGEDFLTDSLIIYIEREFALTIDSDSIIDEYYTLKNRR
ncbi:uncharacterized protein [Henckelia pumila]|uniref:uncharacterized protein n=1 Tax=Henckelia pumila TaxID=405737 RepID=UPI003C6DE7ED